MYTILYIKARKEQTFIKLMYSIIDVILDNVKHIVRYKHEFFMFRVTAGNRMLL